MLTLKGLAILAFVMASPTMAAHGATGLDGTVSVSPARPGPQHIGAPSVAPLAKMVVRVRRSDGHEVAHATSDDQGRFTVSVPVGTYDVVVDVQGAALPRCPVTPARVRDGQLTRVQIVCDSGMR
ncbi:MAG: carboxypeptidase regulatory-like domain-containing protein [Rhodanobacter sp.]|nr:MAG: carboxypeptidase regulatory-like domain-containing protein [Rhodanobacter sp.]TAM09863.1 MAG: carboxypeptidase regulatory-like domain-containing protein [Rhodanobacter sp.]TAM37842.1 MAG: carboxypeptidase regulatory-like domain-containing protein [Rhodanobacter sp.]